MDSLVELRRVDVEVRALGRSTAPPLPETSSTVSQDALTRTEPLGTGPQLHQRCDLEKICPAVEEVDPPGTPSRGNRRGCTRAAGPEYALCPCSTSFSVLRSNLPAPADLHPRGVAS